MKELTAFVAASFGLEEELQVHIREAVLRGDEARVEAEGLAVAVQGLGECLF